MYSEMRLKGLKIFLKISALIQVGYWSFTHLFFPEWFLHSVGVYEVVPQGLMLAFMNEIGILTLGTAVASWMSSKDPLANRTSLVMLYLVGVGSLLLALSQFLLPGRGHGEVTTLVALLVQLILLTALFPRRTEFLRRA